MFAEANFNIDNIRLPAPSPEVSTAATAHEKFLWNPAVMAAIGARMNYTYCSAVVNGDFAAKDCKILPPSRPHLCPLSYVALALISS